MTMRVERRRGKEYIVIDTRPSKRMRRAKDRINKRQREIHGHIKKRDKNERKNSET